MPMPAARIEESSSLPPSPPLFPPKWPANLIQIVSSELTKQRGISIPLMVMNLTWFAKIAITTSFLGRLGELQLAGGTLGLTFANVTGFSVLNGLCGAMEPICGQAYGAKNFKLLHKTLFMTLSLLLLAYLSSQGITIPIMLSSALGVAFHVPINILLSKLRGLEGVSMAVWITNLMIVILLAVYVLIKEVGEGGKWKEGGWLDQGINDWIALLRLSGPCCLTTCLEWWCYEILILLTGRLANAKQAVGVLAIVLNFDYLLFSVMLSLSTCASIRVSNELGANRVGPAYHAAHVSLALGFVSGCIGALVMVAARGVWGPLFSHDKGVIRGVKKMMMLMAAIEVVNFPLVVCGGIVRGTARPCLGMYANLGGFYLLALPLGVVLAFKARFGLEGLLMGFLVGGATCLVLLLVFIARINWAEEADKAQVLAGDVGEKVEEGADSRALERTQNSQV
ncbi:hypothetical protein Ancab_032532 [Ancistrocladus abbreviatus]